MGPLNTGDRARAIALSVVLCFMVLLVAKPVSALSVSPPAVATACIEFVPGSNELTDDGRATLNQVSRLFAGLRPATSVSVHAEYHLDEASGDKAAFRQRVPGLLELGSSRTRSVIGFILENTDAVFPIREDIEVGAGRCPVRLLVSLQRTSPNLQCDKNSCR